MDTPRTPGAPPRTVEVTVTVDLDAYEAFLVRYNDDVDGADPSDLFDHYRSWSDLVHDALRARVAADPSAFDGLPWVREICG